MIEKPYMVNNEVGCFGEEPLWENEMREGHEVWRESIRREGVRVRNEVWVLMKGQQRKEEGGSIRREGGRVRNEVWVLMKGQQRKERGRESSE